MKIIFKWAGIWVIPSILLFLYIYAGDGNSQFKGAFFVVHYLSAGVAIYLTLTELKRKSVEAVSALRYIIVGVLTAVSHSLIFGFFSGLYFNVLNTEAKEKYIETELYPAVVRGFDSTASTKAEYYEHLMVGKDSGVLLPERYAEFKKAANDSLTKVDHTVNDIVKKNFSFYGMMILWVGFAPVIGILFSVIVTVFVTKR